jgi:hypothetical protein
VRRRRSDRRGGRDDGSRCWGPRGRRRRQGADLERPAGAPTLDQPHLPQSVQGKAQAELVDAQRLFERIGRSEPVERAQQPVFERGEPGLVAHVLVPPLVPVEDAEGAATAELGLEHLVPERRNGPAEEARILLRGPHQHLLDRERTQVEVAHHLALVELVGPRLPTEQSQQQQVGVLANATREGVGRHQPGREQVIDHAAVELGRLDRGDLVAIEVAGGDQDAPEPVGERLLERVGAHDLAVPESDREHVVGLDAQRAARVAGAEQQQHPIDAAIGEVSARPHRSLPTAHSTSA